MGGDEGTVVDSSYPFLAGHLKLIQFNKLICFPFSLFQYVRICNGFSFINTVLFNSLSGLICEYRFLKSS